MHASTTTAELADRLDELLDGLADGCIADAISAIISTRLVAAHRAAFHPDLHPAIDAAARLWIDLDLTVSFIGLAESLWAHDKAHRATSSHDPAARLVIGCVRRPDPERHKQGYLMAMLDFCMFWRQAGFPESALAAHLLAEAQGIVATHHLASTILYPASSTGLWLAPWGA